MVILFPRKRGINIHVYYSLDVELFDGKTYDFGRQSDFDENKIFTEQSLKKEEQQ